ncbi:PadR family transcriptional regulator [Agromyces sp. CFH 90414]|uniref:PadR family transcriptional regulator n=1 Tax=Agromyces agglutinans TaxID=2662258 RepID=A0A6I2FE09_9MICO|nr:PadR family transcriptional regulator [Agromyces agglutinans]MRG59338.1 PadR family transcriptional regulator [Agromyces agglutinans]
MTPPVFAHGSLRLYLLALLDEHARHGYELIQALSERFGGTYSPSAGTIYPRLSKLEEEGLVTKTADGRKTVYSITDAGRAELEGRRHELDAIEDEVTDSVRRLADGVRAEVDEAMRTLRAELASAAREAKRSAKRSTRTTMGSPGGTDAGGGADSGGADAAGAGGAAGSASAGASGGTTNLQTETNRAVHEADLVLAEFRQQVRTDLRTQAHRARVSPESVAMLRTRLAEVRAALLADLQR